MIRKAVFLQYSKRKITKQSPKHQLFHLEDLNQSVKDLEQFLPTPEKKDSKNLLKTVTFNWLCNSTQRYILRSSIF